MPQLIVIVGATAVGKTSFAIEKAKELNTVILSADSRQLYKEMNIGVARPTKKELNEVPHYFIASHSIHQSYSAGKYELEVLQLLDTLFQQHNTVLLVGGSGLYIDAVCYGIDDLPSDTAEIREYLTQLLNTEGLESLRILLQKYDPVTYQQIDIKNPNRVIRALEVCIYTGKTFSELRTAKRKIRPFDIQFIGLQRNREDLYHRINQRVVEMMENGLQQEVQELYPYKNLKALQTVGYRELFDYMDNKTTLDQAISLIQRNTRHFAKRQITWFKKYQPIEWVNL